MIDSSAAVATRRVMGGPGTVCSPRPDVASSVVRGDAPPIDFSTIDTPQKAALLPTLDATALIVTLQGLEDAMEAGRAIDERIEARYGADATAQITSHMDAGGTVLQRSGTLGGVPMTEIWTIDPNTSAIAIEGDIGGTHASLIVRGSDEATTIEGSIGAMPVRETVTADSDGRNVQFNFAGSIGDQPLQETLSWSLHPRGALAFHTTGKVGEAEVDVRSEFTQRNGASKLHGQGILAGSAIEFTQTIT